MQVKTNIYSESDDTTTLMIPLPTEDENHSSADTEICALMMLFLVVVEKHSTFWYCLL